MKSSPKLPSEPPKNHQGIPGIRKCERCISNFLINSYHHQINSLIR